MIDVRARLTAPELPVLVSALGFRGPDVADVLAAAGSVAACAPDLERVELLAERLLGRVGDLDVYGPDGPLDADAARAEHRGMGILAMLALLATAPEVAAFHARRGVDPAVSERSLSDLGQQVWVHRQTYGEFGLHNYAWLQIAWAGALYWLGRLQFNLKPAGDAWELSTHIPATGPLTPEAVDSSFAWARTFFAEHFPDCPSIDFHCSSWLLDPYLAEHLPADSNMARFQRRWRLYGEPMPADSDVLFFLFHRRGDVDLDRLPRDTRLQRAVLDRLQSGRHWQTWQGRIAQSEAVLSATAPS